MVLAFWSFLGLDQLAVLPGNRTETGLDFKALRPLDATSRSWGIAGTEQLPWWSQSCQLQYGRDRSYLVRLTLGQRWRLTSGHQRQIALLWSNAISCHFWWDWRGDKHDERSLEWTNSRSWWSWRNIGLPSCWLGSAIPPLQQSWLGPSLPSCETQSHQGTLPWSSQLHIYQVSGRACASSGVPGPGRWLPSAALVSPWISGRLSKVQCRTWTRVLQCTD